MQSPENVGKKNEKLMGEQEKGSFSISLWQNAFKVALSRLCPTRGEGHECGCLPILSKMVLILYNFKVQGNSINKLL